MFSLRGLSVPLPGRLTVARAAYSSRPAFVLQCRKVVIEFCANGLSSQGLRAYIRNGLVEFARSNPEIEFVVQQKAAHHPHLKGFYLNGRDKVICVRNMETTKIAQKLELLRDSSGAKLHSRHHLRPVTSTQESVRGIWSGLHAPPFEI